MAISDECLRHAVECERDAAACGPGFSRDTLLETGAIWRRMAATAKLEETTWSILAGISLAPKSKDEDLH